jgi:hypothetical protein
MLTINLLTERRDAEQAYRRMRDGYPVGYVNYLEDHFAMQVDRTVRRRVHQNIRNDKKASIKRARKDQLLRDRRAGMSAVGNIFLGANGEPNLDVLKPAKSGGKEKGYRPIPSDEHVKPAHFPTTKYTPLDDHNHVQRAKRLGKAKMPRLKTNFCPECNTYVTADHPQHC